jgi:hypothetical protein
MAAPTPENGARGYEIPIVLHETTEFDASPDPAPGDAGGLTRCDELLPLTEFDCSQQAEKEAADRGASEK